MPHATSPFATIDRVRHRAASAAVSWSALASEPLRAHLLETLAERNGRHSFMADPVIEVASTHGALPAKPSPLFPGDCCNRIL
jgi:hypothetical protein